MKKLQIILSTALLGSVLGTIAPLFGQNESPCPDKPDPRKLSIMVGLVRTINTAEVSEQATYGSFASWQTLLAHQQSLNEWLTNSYSRDPNAHFGSGPEILPAWSLRLTVQSDSSGWVVMLQNEQDKNGYAVLSDERGVIWVCRPLQ